MSSLQNPVLLAKIGAPHGVRGQVRVTSYTQDVTAFGNYGPLISKDGRKFSVANARAAKNIVVVTFKGITSREEAEKIRGLELFIERNSLPDTDDDDDFYINDLVGMQVKEPTGEAVGKIAAIQNFGAGDLLEIIPLANTEKLPGGSWFIAFTRQNVPEIDLENRRVTIVRPEEISERDQQLDELPEDSKKGQRNER